MKRQSLMVLIASVALLGGLSACGGSDDKAGPKPTKSTTSPSPSTAAQPKGADGVTIEIQNWDAYADDPAVLAWKQTTEVFNASGNHGKILPGMREGFSASIFRHYVRNLENYVWKNDWHVTSRIPAKVQQARTVGSRADLVTCLWAPDYSLRKKDGAHVVKTPKEWDRHRIELKTVGGRWVITKITIKGKCSGGVPA